MSRADEIRDVVSKARSLDPTISTTTVEQYLSSALSIEAIRSDLFGRVCKALAARKHDPELVDMAEN